MYCMIRLDRREVTEKVNTEACTANRISYCSFSIVKYFSFRGSSFQQNWLPGAPHLAHQSDLSFCSVSMQSNCGCIRTASELTK